MPGALGFVQVFVLVFAPAVGVPLVLAVAFAPAVLVQVPERGLGFVQVTEQVKALIRALSGHAFRLLLNFCQTCILYFYL